MSSDVEIVKSQNTAQNIPGTASGGVTVAASTTSAHPKHPLDPLTPEEIAAVSLAIRKHVTSTTGVKALKFITSNIIPPKKKDVLASLGIPLATGQAPEPVPAPELLARRAESDLIDLVTGDAYNVIASVKGEEWVVEVVTKLPEGTQPQISVEELAQAENVVKTDPRVVALAKEIGIEAENIACDGWAIGYDERFPKSKRIQQALMFARFGKHENLYAHPLDFVPVLDSNTMKVIHIDFPPRRDSSGKLSVATTYGVYKDTITPSSESTDAPSSQAIANRERIPPPLTPFNFLPEEQPDYAPRTDLKPLHILQPEGVSFKMDGNELEWQKWKMHIGFHHREGVVISTVTYNDNGLVRPIFYRLSMSEMVVPYAAPEFPHPRKFAFDSGEYGMGTMANDLSLGCDCLGTIHYLPGCFVAHDGSAIKIKNAICIHEEDDGLLWKHTDYRPGGKSFAARSRRLVVSMCCTLANYEYIWNYRFYQDGSVEFEVRLTGILQVYVQPSSESYVESNPYGTTVAPNVNAHYHQHLFSLRVDPMIDGLQNSVLETDVVANPAPFESDDNFAGNAFTTKSRTIQTSADARDYDHASDRRWRIVSSPKSTKYGSKGHYASGAPPGYGFNVRGAGCTLLAREGSWAWKRAPWGRKVLWVVKDNEGEDGSRIYPSGKYVPQTREEPEESLNFWSKEDKSVVDEDILLYITLGTNHIPRPEDWPVMPYEHLNVLFKPQHFFDYSAAMDVPAASDKKSCAAFSETGSEKKSCCA